MEKLALQFGVSIENDHLIEVIRARLLGADNIHPIHRAELQQVAADDTNENMKAKINLEENLIVEEIMTQ